MFLFSPGSIFYPPYVASAAALTLLWLRFSRSGKVLPVRSWVGRSTWIDLALCFVNLVVLHEALARFESRLFNGIVERGEFRAPWVFQPARVVEGALATAATMLAIDFASYGAHRLLHRSKLLWSAHALHHSAEILTPLTTYRQHPVELFFLNGARTIASACALLVLGAFLPRVPDVVTIGGLGAGFFVYMFTVNLHHSMVPVRYPRWMRWVLVSPHIHHLHHSRAERHFGKNYGVVFSVWDRIFGTYLDEEFEAGELGFGLEDKIPGGALVADPGIENEGPAYQPPPPPELFSSF